MPYFRFRTSIILFYPHYGEFAIHRASLYLIKGGGQTGVNRSNNITPPQSASKASDTAGQSASKREGQERTILEGKTPGETSAILSAETQGRMARISEYE